MGGIAAAIAALPAYPRPVSDRFRKPMPQHRWADGFANCSAETIRSNASRSTTVNRRASSISRASLLYRGRDSGRIENGYPDWGLTSFTELIEYASRIVDQIDIPMLADADNGGGNPLTVYRTTRAFERAGVGAVMFEDRIRNRKNRPNRRRHSDRGDGGSNRAAVDARSEMVIVARSDALAAGRSEAEAFERGGAYAEAGAEALFLGGLPLAGNRRAADAIDVALMGPMGAGTPMSDAAEARVTIALCANFLQNIAQGAIYNALEELKTTGTMAETMSRIPCPVRSTGRLPETTKFWNARANTMSRPRNQNLLDFGSNQGGAGHHRLHLSEGRGSALLHPATDPMSSTCARPGGSAGRRLRQSPLRRSKGRSLPK